MSFLSQLSYSLNQNSQSFVDQKFLPYQVCKNCHGQKFVKKNGKLMMCTVCKNDILLSKSLSLREKSGQNQNENAVDSFANGAYHEFTKGRNLGNDARRAGEATGRFVRESIETIGRGVNNNDDGGWSMDPKNVYGK